MFHPWQGPEKKHGLREKTLVGDQNKKIHRTFFLFKLTTKKKKAIPPSQTGPRQKKTWIAGDKTFPSRGPNQKKKKCSQAHAEHTEFFLFAAQSLSRVCLSLLIFLRGLTQNSIIWVAKRKNSEFYNILYSKADLSHTPRTMALPCTKGVPVERWNSLDSGLGTSRDDHASKCWKMSIP